MSSCMSIEARRSFLCGLGSSLGAVALTSQLAAEGVTAATGPLSPKAPMLPAKAKNVIMLFMEGGTGANGYL